MRKRTSTRLLSTSLFAAVIAGSLVASADPPASAPSHSGPEAARAIYRFEITVRRADDAPNAHPATYTISLEENRSGTVSIGSNIALIASNAAPGTTAQRQDVGLMLHLSFVLQGNTVVLAGNAEMSTAETSASGPVSIHRVRADGVVPLTPGHPSLFTSIADLTTHGTYQIMITTTRLL